ncbi:MAG: hypothetical protein WAW35_05670 [Sideroxyarcus sp.]
MERGVRFVVLNLFVAALALVSACVQTSQTLARTETKSAFTTPDEKPRVPDEYIITLSPDADKNIIAEHYGRYGIKDIYALGGETYLLVLLNDPGPRKMEAVIYDDTRVMVVQPNLVYWDNRSGSIK